MIDERDRLNRQEEFYQETGAIKGLTAANELLYITAHTNYLRDGINYKAEILQAWREEFSLRLSDNAWRYINELYPAFVNIAIIEDIKQGRELSRTFVKWKTLIRFEMDLKLIECAENNVPFSKEKFRDFINDKYNFHFESILDDLELKDVPYIEDFTNIAKALLPYKEKIKNIYDVFVKTYDEEIKSRMNSDRRNDSRSGDRRRRNYRPRTDRNFSDVRKFDTENKSANVPATTNITSREIDNQPAPAMSNENVAAETVPADKIQPAPVDAETAKEHALKDYEVIIAEYEEKIRRLENDVAEYQRRHDEIREYSVTQYDRGVKDLFNLLNDKRYSKPIEFLYKLMRNPALDANVRSYLENFFLALEEMDIEPIVQTGKPLVVDITKMTANYNLEFDIKDFVPEKTTVKYVGWKYKDSILEKPTLGKNNA